MKHRWRAPKEPDCPFRWNRRKVKSHPHPLGPPIPPQEQHRAGRPLGAARELSRSPGTHRWAPRPLQTGPQDSSPRALEQSGLAEDSPAPGRHPKMPHSLQTPPVFPAQPGELIVSVPPPAPCVVLRREASWWLPRMRKTGVFLFCFLLNKLAVLNLAGWSLDSTAQ